MSYMNKVFLMGNLTADPEVRYTTSGLAVCLLRLAVNRSFTDRAGAQQEEVCFIDIDVFAKQAETCGKYLRKGSPTLIEGRLKLDQWEDKQSGQKRSKLKVVAENVQFLGSPRGTFEQDDRGARDENDRSGRDGDNRNRFSRPPQQQQSAQPQRHSQPEAPPPPPFDDVPDDVDDVPF